MIRNHEFIVFGAEHYNPLTVIRSIGKGGIKPVFIGIKNKGPIASKSMYLKESYIVDSIEEGYEVLLRVYGKKEEKPFLFTTDDDVQSYLDQRYDELVNKFYFFQAGRAGRVTEFMDKKNVLDLAARHGLNILPTVVVKHGEVPDGLPYPILTKSISPNIGGWKSDVHICNNAEELRKAYDHILSPLVVIQPYLDKKTEYGIDGFSVDNGQKLFTPFGSAYNYAIRGYYSPFMTYYPIEDSQLLKACTAMMTEVGYEGIFDFEFLVDKNDKLYFSEINFRVNPWSYAAAKLGMPLPLLWAEAMLTGELNSDALQKPIPKGYMSMIEPVDYSKRVEQGNTDLGEWLFDFKRTECPFYYDEEDKEPFLEMAKNWKLYS